MSHRGLVSAAMLALVTVMSLADALVTAQAPRTAPYTPPTSTYTPPRTPWGDPDLMGVWDYQSVIRMQRPNDLAGKARFTDEAEYEAWAKANAPNRDNQTQGVGAYNEFWNDRNFLKNLNTSLIVDPPNGRYPPLTPAAEHRRKEIVAKAREVASWEDYHALERCIASQTPNAPQAYNSGTYIMQSPGWVMIVRERLDTRLIPLDGRPHIGQNIRHWNGDSVGRWEGNTLVVETTNFTDKQRMGGASGASVPAGIPFGNFRLTEHFVPVSPHRIEYYATINDPTTWTRPWTFNLPWERDDDYTILEYACHEGNIAMGNSLRGERVLEAEAAKKREAGK
jgi:hypothetical protein